MFKQLLQAQSISIIGGADGPTSIYVSSACLWQIIAIILCVIALIVFGICKLVKNIKKSNKVKILLWSSVLFILIFLVFIIPIWNLIETRKQMKMLETDIFTASINEEKYYGFATEANDFNYFFENNKIINVDIGFGGTGFVIGKPLGINQFKCIKEIYGSGVSIVAEDSFIGTIDGNVLRFDNDNNEFFILDNNVIRYFYQNKEYQIYGIIDNNITYKIKY